ncbi:permease [Flammeovirga aprica JL-4]|uniref:Permease n=2 Tax=Flammeovirga aprica TaxID=29528 RepID=A0A7X9S0J5_9BACT|nr:permease [Flammeovirga aprica JL-4]
MIKKNETTQCDLSTPVVSSERKIKKRRTQLLISIAVLLPLLIIFYWFLPDIINYFTFDLLHLSPNSHFGKAVNFFFYDTIKILILLFLISSLMGAVNVYFPVDRLRIFLTTKKLYGLEYFLASFFGAVTPFCSCSSIPLFIGFVKGGIPLGVTFAYLITSPLVNEVAVAMFLGLFGIKATAFYTGSGILMGMLGGYALGKMKLDRYLSDWVRQVQENATRENEKWEGEKTPFIDRLPSIIREGWDIVRKVLLYVIIGIAIGAGMHGYVPENFFTEYLSADKWYAVPLAVILAVPMYANAAGVVPIIQVFVAKGVPLGTAIAFMMAVVGLSLPEATLLKKVMTWKLIGIFFGTITLFIIALGYLFNCIL